MIIWDDAQTLYQKFTADDSAAGLTHGKLLLNIGYKEILSEFSVEEGERTKQVTTVADQRGYKLPQDFLKIHSVKATSGGTTYPVWEEESQEMWDYRTEHDREAAFPEAFFIRPRFGVRGSELLLDPIPTNATTTITITYTATARDLAVDKYTTGTIAVTNASATVTGTSTTWTAAMTDRYFQITDSDGDGQWYRISSVGSTTSLTLENYYDGTTDTSANYQIAEAFHLPEELQILPVYWAAAHFYSEQQNIKQEQKYRDLYLGLLAKYKKKYKTKSTSQIIRGDRGGGSFATYPRHFPNSVSGS